MSKDLWPEKFVETEIVSPIAILKEQANFLTKKTNSVVIGKVTMGKSSTANLPSFTATLELFCPLLNDYTFLLFTMYYSLESLYPVFLINVKVMGENAKPERRNFKAETQEELEAVFERVFSDPVTLKTIESMLAHSIGMRK